MSTTNSVVADSATTPSLFNLPEIPESSTCKQQVAPNVGAMEPGQVVDGEYGPATVLRIEVSKWRFSEKPKHSLTLLDHDSGEEYTRGYFPWSPIKDNHAYEAQFSAPHAAPKVLAPRNPYRSQPGATSLRTWL